MSRLFGQILKLMDKSMDLSGILNIPLEQNNTPNEVIPDQHVYIFTWFIAMKAHYKVLSYFAFELVSKSWHGCVRN